MTYEGRFAIRLHRAEAAPLLLRGGGFKSFPPPSKTGAVERPSWQAEFVSFHAAAIAFFGCRQDGGSSPGT